MPGSSWATSRTSACKRETVVLGRALPRELRCSARRTDDGQARGRDRVERRRARATTRFRSQPPSHPARGVGAAQHRRCPDRGGAGGAGQPPLRLSATRQHAGAAQEPGLRHPGGRPFALGPARGPRRPHQELAGFSWPRAPCRLRPVADPGGDRRQHHGVLLPGRRQDLARAARRPPAARAAQSVGRQCRARRSQHVRTHPAHSPDHRRPSSPGDPLPGGHQRHVHRRAP